MTDLIPKIEKYVFRLKMTIRETPAALELIDSKNRVAGKILADGTVESIYRGKQNLLGALARLELEKRLSGAVID